MSSGRGNQILSAIAGLLLMAFVCWYGYTHWDSLLELPYPALVGLSFLLSLGHILLGFSAASIIWSVRIVTRGYGRSIAGIESAIQLFVSAALSVFIGGMLSCVVLFMNMLSAGISKSGVAQNGLWAIGITAVCSFLLAGLINIGIKRGRRILFEHNVRTSGASDANFQDRENPSLVVTGCLGAFVATGIFLAIAALFGESMYARPVELQIFNRSAVDVLIQVERLHETSTQEKPDLVYVVEKPWLGAGESKVLFVRMLSSDVNGLLIYMLDTDENKREKLELPLSRDEVSSGAYYNIIIDSSGMRLSSPKKTREINGGAPVNRRE